MMQQTRKMSEILKEMSERLFRRPNDTPTSEAAHIALMFANFAWNESVGMEHPRNSYRSAWESIEADNPELWSELKSNDVDSMIDELVVFKKQHYPDDLRRILLCGIPNSKIHVEWLAAVKPGVDSKWEMHLYFLVRMGERVKAIQYLRQTRRMSRQDAANKVLSIAAEFGMT